MKNLFNVKFLFDIENSVMPSGEGWGWLNDIIELAQFELREFGTIDYDEVFLAEFDSDEIKQHSHFGLILKGEIRERLNLKQLKQLYSKLTRGSIVLAKGVGLTEFSINHRGNKLTSDKWSKFIFDAD